MESCEQLHVYRAVLYVELAGVDEDVVEYLEVKF